MIILGIDPGLNATGYGVIQEEAQTLRVLAAGTIHPPASKPLGARLAHLYEELNHVIDAHHPTWLALESLFVHHAHLMTAALMAHARAVACLVAVQRGLTVSEYLPTRVKKALTGHGRASKEQVARAVGMWLGVREKSWSADATDALALAIAHAHIAKSPITRLEARKSVRRPALPAALLARVVAG